MSRILDMLQKEEENYHPLVAIHGISRRCGEDLRLELDCHRTIAKYVEAERKSIDVKTEDGAELVHLIINVGDES